MVVNKWRLVDESGNPVPRGSLVEMSDGKVLLDGGAPPKHAASTGRIYVKDPSDPSKSCREYFPSVCKLRWTYMTDSELLVEETK